MACEILVPHVRDQTHTSALETWSLNSWLGVLTRLPEKSSLMIFFLLFYLDMARFSPLAFIRVGLVTVKEIKTYNGMIK